MQQWNGLSDLLGSLAEQHGGRTAIVDRERCFGFDDLDACASAIGAHAHRASAGRPWRCAILMDNVFEHVCAFVGVMRSGCVAVPLNTSLKPDEIDHQIRSADARMVLVSPRLAPVVGALLARGPSTLTHVMVVESWREDDDAATNTGLGGGQHTVTHVRPTDVRGATCDVDTHADDAAVLWYTSGTTGQPKGALHSHRSCVNTVRAWSDYWDFTTDDRGVVRNMYHVGMLPTIVPLLAAGASAVMAGTFSLDSVLADVERHRVTIWRAFPMVLGLIDKRPDVLDRYDLSSVRRIGVGAAPTDASLLARSIERFPDVEWDQGWSQSELNGGGISNRGQQFLRRPDSIGLPLGCIDEVVVLDADRNPVPCGQIGELWVSGDTIMMGYDGDARATSEVIVDGRLRTGDLARLDDDGFVYLVGRERDLIIRGGENVHPGEVEAVLAGHPDVSEAAVVGIADSVMGEVPIAFVVLREGATTSAGTLLDLARERLARFKCPVHVEIVDDLPRNAVGKVQKFRLVEQAGSHGR